MDTYFTENNHVLLASKGYEYDGAFIKMLNIKGLKHHLAVHHVLTKMAYSNHQQILPAFWSLHIEN
jgi:hypothetical protein